MSALPQWLPVKEVAELLGHSSAAPLRRDLRLGKYSHKFEEGPTGRQYRIDLGSLPKEVQAKYWKLHLQSEALTVESPSEEVDVEMEIYHKAPAWARKKADKYLAIIRAAHGLKGDELKAFVNDWNQKHPDMTTSYPRVLAARKEYQEEGLSALLAGYGHRMGQTSVREEWYEYYRSLYLKEGGPSSFSCWFQTLGFAVKLDPTLSEFTFPSYKAFERLLENRIPEDAIYLARNGHSRWYRKYASYVDRDFSQVEVGKCWVSDHAQVDVMVMHNSKPCFPWITVWRDLKSGKWIGWYLHADAPDSDDIFQSFFYAARDYGLPSDIIIDNGKDYRSKDFAGGRKMQKVTVEQSYAGSLTTGLGIQVHYALPYNAQTKPIERDFLKQKEWFSKHMPGYRGGNVVERPEGLEDELRAGKIMSLTECGKLLDVYITEVLNCMPSQGKVLKGLSPNAYWQANIKSIRRVGPEALKMFCMRIKGSVAIGRNGVKDSELGVTYWGEWMAGIKGQHVYLRRDIKAFQDAWVFHAETDEYLGRAVMVESLNAIVRNDVDKSKLKNLMALKRHDLKIKRELIRTEERPTPEEALQHMAAGAAALTASRQNSSAQPTEIFQITPLDKAIAQEKKMEAAGTADLAGIAPPQKKKTKLFTFFHEKEAHEKEERKKAAGT